MTIEQLQYPIGKFEKPITITKDILLNWIADISSFATRLKNETSGLTDAQLDTQYRPNGWTLRQVIHHCADSHMNSFIRLKLTLTENIAIIKPYYEELWAELNDSKSMPIESSLKILEGIHIRWAHLLHNLSEDDYKKMFIHPEDNNTFSIDEIIGIYSWHCNHHLAQITATKKSNNWKNKE